MKKARSLENSRFLTLRSTGDERIELPPKVLETPIIPFDQSPIYRKNLTPVAALNFLGTFILYLQNFTQKEVSSKAYLLETSKDKSSTY